MSLQFHQPVENMEIWCANGDDVSFVITFASPTGAGFHGRHGFLASWRPLYSRVGAIKIIGSPFNSLGEAEGACNAMLGTLKTARTDVARAPAQLADLCVSTVPVTRVMEQSFT